MTAARCECGHPESRHKFGAAECGVLGCPCNVWRPASAELPDPPVRVHRDAFLTQIHELGLDALVLDETDPRPGVRVSQDQLLAILRLLELSPEERRAESLRYMSQLRAVRDLARSWASRAVELDDLAAAREPRRGWRHPDNTYDEADHADDVSDPRPAPTRGDHYTARALTYCAGAVFAVTDPELAD
ncbi:MAG TPA: hypothetical protein VLE97_07985 [Gaiellaceae bacterium]|nr:hypothetical protein [Gaiellaceae bacterium]